VRLARRDATNERLLCQHIGFFVAGFIYDVHLVVLRQDQDIVARLNILSDAEDRVAESGAVAIRLGVQFPEKMASIERASVV